jgi:predicted acetyltransferase
MLNPPKTIPMPTLVKATLSDHRVIQNMARFYVYDMSRYCGHSPGWECPDDGLFECVDLKNYFTDIENHAFFIKVGPEIAGFVLINKVGSSADVDWNMGEFFVLAKFQKSGIGQHIAKEVFNRFDGVWEVASIPENTRALMFWKKTVGEYTKDDFSEEQKVVQHPEPHPMVILRFESEVANSTLGRRK